MSNSGWICPRCDKVKSPNVEECNCRKTRDQSLCKHTFCVLDDNGVIDYPCCPKCGAINNGIQYPMDRY